MSRSGEKGKVCTILEDVAFLPYNQAALIFIMRWIPDLSGCDFFPVSVLYSLFLTFFFFNWLLWTDRHYYYTKLILMVMMIRFSIIVYILSHTTWNRLVFSFFFFFLWGWKWQVKVIKKPLLLYEMRWFLRPSFVSRISTAVWMAPCKWNHLTIEWVIVIL